jgi:hypothetical protein
VIEQSRDGDTPLNRYRRLRHLVLATEVIELLGKDALLNALIIGQRMATSCTKHVPSGTKKPALSREAPGTEDRPVPIDRRYPPRPPHEPTAY